MKIPSTPQLTESVLQNLTKEIHEFANWISTDKNDFQIEFITINEDWFLNRYSDILKLNCWIGQSCTPDFLTIVMLHEAVHVIMNNIPTKEDVKFVRDHFHSLAMNATDIEADTIVFKYLKETKDWSFDRYIAVLHENANIFGDLKPRTVKIERFLGSLCSIKYFALYQKGVIMIPSLDDCIGDSHSILFWLIPKSGVPFAFRFVDVPARIYKDVIRIYTSPSRFSETGYLKIITEFTENVCSSLFPPKLSA